MMEKTMATGVEDVKYRGVSPEKGPFSAVKRRSAWPFRHDFAGKRFT